MRVDFFIEELRWSDGDESTDRIQASSGCRDSHEPEPSVCPFSHDPEPSDSHDN